MTPTNPPSATGSEWGRLLGGTTVQQGDLQEAFHPNAFAQAALGRLPAPGLHRRAGRVQLHRRAGQGAGRRGGHAHRPGRDRPRPSRPRAGGRSSSSVRRAKARRRGQACYAFSVTTNGRRVVKSLVRFAGHYKRTGKVGRATLCTAKRPATQSARATRKGYVKTARTVHVPRR